MATNTASNFNTGGAYGTGDVENYIAEKVLPRSIRQLVAYQFGDPLRLEKGRGATYAASRYDRINLPFTTLSEGVGPTGQIMPLAQVSATAQQWGDKVLITDVAELTIKHPLFQLAIDLTAMQLAETLERNTFNALMAGTQINYATYDGTARTNRAGLRQTSSAATSDVLTPHEINRVFGALITNGAPRFMGDEREDMKLGVDANTLASRNPSGMPHYAAIVHPLVEQDMRENSTVLTAWSYSDINRLYNNELGELNGIRFCRSNMVPYFTGVAQVNGTGSGTGGTLAANTYYIQVTGSPTTTNYEQRIYQISTGITTTGATSSISVTVPTLAGYTFSIYIGTTTSPTNLGLSTSGPTTGPMAGQAVQIASGATAVITAIGAAQTPPAAPATGTTVYPTFVFGRNAYGQVMLDDAQFFYLRNADKSDPLNQLRSVGWKVYYGTLIENQQFFARVESVSMFSATYS